MTGGGAFPTSGTSRIGATRRFDLKHVLANQQNMTVKAPDL
jgi:hypothetical protein